MKLAGLFNTISFNTWLFCCLCLFSPISHSQTPANFDALLAAPADTAQLQQLAEQLDMGTNAQGQFTQARYLKVLQKPLVSQGTFFFKAEVGLAWLQQTPFESGLVLTQGTLVQIDSEGQRQISHASDNQQASGVAQMMPGLMSALLQGQLAPLAEQFSLHLIKQQQTWQLGLVPLDPLLAKAMQAIVLEGEQQLNSLTLLNHNGDRSLITFEQISSAPLTQTQLDYFATSAEPARAP
ncbi:outer membrane lipoprotein carrier protein LolA [Shewanella sp. Isolate11]|uniref:outer membrane lipoprotein carrier protein LolA n=1 Tax=Shewanella sp. Isolate11 TaxID=2908530 RepID=UPI001EFDA105|nr:outer membrane lipoprotein carrier protein LolA [Shewanella sp. Isolate11]MCG9697836.1 outer membrane lipoprotein carrier protein LolA [Shewanella sp. Isolate11]